MADLTRKQEIFVAEYIETGNGTQSALKAYDIQSKNPEKVAAVIANENLTKPNIIQALEEALPESMLNEIHIEGLYATRPVYNAKGELINEEADFAVRAKYLDMALKRKGGYAPDKHVTVNVDTPPTKEILDATQLLDEYFRNNPSGDGTPTRSMGNQTQG